MRTPFTHWTLALGLGLLPLAAQPSAAPSVSLAPHKGFNRLAERLQLTEAQKTQIQAVQARHAESLQAKAKAVAEARKAFREAERNPEAATDQLKALHQAKADKDFDLRLAQRSRQSELRALLTPEQRTEWDRLQAYHQGAKHRGHGKGGRGAAMGF